MTIHEDHGYSVGHADGYMLTQLLGYKRCHSPTVAGSIPMDSKHFAEFTLNFTIKQYKNARSANFV